MRHFLLATSIAVAAAAAGGAQAATVGPAWTFTAIGRINNNNDWTFAVNFEVLRPVTVTGLGYFADPTTSAVDANPVALFACDSPACDTTGTLLASAVVDNSFPVTDFFRFVTIAPVNLAPGFYQVGGISRGDNYTWNTVGFATNPDIRYVANTWVLTSGAATPSFLNFVQNDVTDGVWGPNLFLGTPTFANVPAPAALATFGLGLLGLAALRRRAA